MTCRSLWTKRTLHLDLHVAEAGPVDVQPWRQNVAEAAVDPHQAALVVLEIDHHGAVAQQVRLDEHVELIVHQPRIALRHDLDLHV